MDNRFLNLIKVNRDAPHVNRGFYFQYLIVVRKWIENYIRGNEIMVYTEVGNDIKEVGDQLIYTQVKCFTSSFSFKSVPLKKELLGFFLQYLEEKEINPELEFHFITNSSIKKKEALLQKWILSQPLTDGKLLDQCSEQIKEIIETQLQKLYDAQSTKSRLADLEKIELKTSFDEIKNLLYRDCHDFTGKIKWVFENDTPQQSIIDLHSQILRSLEHERFKSKPPSILFEALLSEVYRRSQLEVEDERMVDNLLLDDILRLKDEEFSQFINSALIDLLEVKFYSIYKQIQELEIIQKQHTEKIKSNTDKIESIIQNTSNFIKLPKNLTSIPHIYPSDIFGRSAEIESIKKLLEANKCLLINGGGGMGKSLLSKLYAQLYQDDFKHLIWIDCETGLQEGFVINEILSERLGIDDNIEANKKFNAIITKLESLEAGGLIILDNLHETTEKLNLLGGLNNWHLIITSRHRISGLVVHEVERLSFSAAKALYKKFDPDGSISDEHLLLLFEYIDYNTLTIELIAKTIHLSFDLTVETFLVYLKNQELDDDNLDIDTEPGMSTRLLRILDKTFDLNKLSGQERYYIEFFALLPSEGIALSDLVTWYGKEFESVNKVELARSVNSLHRKGLIKRSGAQIEMDKIFQETVRYQARDTISPFIGQMFHVSFLAARLKEGIEGDPQQALHFLKYAQSFLKNIKEPYRRCIYQPLLLLENETLYVTSWLDGAKAILPLWKNLIERAEAALGKEDLLVGTISNNYALALFGEDRPEEAAIYFDTAITIFKKNNVNAGNLLYMLTNRAHIYLSQNDYKSFGQIFEQMTEIRNANNLWDDPTFPIQCHSLAMAHMTTKNFKSAKDMFALAIISHKKLPDEKRNDINLISFMCDMAHCCLALEDSELAEKAAIEATHHLHLLNISKGLPMIKVLRILIVLANHSGDTENEEKLKEILSSQLSDE